MESLLSSQSNFSNVGPEHEFYKSRSLLMQFLIAPECINVRTVLKTLKVL